MVVSLGAIIRNSILSWMEAPKKALPFPFTIGMVGSAGDLLAKVWEATHSFLEENEETIEGTISTPKL